MMEGLNPEILIKICTTKMPFGKYKGIFICDLPVSYLEWFKRKNAFPQGSLGMQMQTLYEIKTNGLDELLQPIKAKYRKQP